MWNRQNIAARMLIWLAAFVVPAQGLPAASCGCVRGQACPSRPKSCCCSSETRAETTCCCRPTQPAGMSCCDKAEQECSCGSSCQCGNQFPITPTTPLENRVLRKVTDAITYQVGVGLGDSSKTSRERCSKPVAADAMAALDRCVCLCRFTL